MSAVNNSLARVRELAMAIFQEAPDHNAQWQQLSIKPKAQEIVEQIDWIISTLHGVGPGHQDQGAPGSR